MIKKLFRNQAAKGKNGFWLLNQDKFSQFLFYLLVLFLPTQLGKHFWPQFSFIQGIRLDYLSPTAYFTDILILLIILFSYSKIVKFILFQRKKNIFLGLLFFLSLLIGVSTSRNPQAGTFAIVKLIEYLLIAVFITTSFRQINKKYFALILACGVMFESVHSFIQIINNGSLNGVFYFLGERYFTAQTPGIANASISGQLFLRPYATFPHPNVLAGYLIIATLFVYMFKNYISKQILFLVFITTSVSLVFTLSRVAILFWIILLVLKFGSLLLEKYKKRTLNKKNTTGIFLIICLILFLFTLFQKNIFIQRFFQTSISEESFTQRKQLVNESIKMFAKSPVFGVGINNFYNNLSIPIDKSPFIQPVHNIFLFIIAETGIIGFCFFLLLIFKFIKDPFAKNEKNISLALILVIVITGMFDHYFLTIQQGQLLFVLIISERFSAKINK